MEYLLGLLPGPQPLLTRYGATIAMVMLAFGLRLLLPGGAYGFIFFIPAIVAAGLIFDRGSGFLAVALSTALIAGRLSWNEAAPYHIAALGCFIAVGSGLVLLGEGLHRMLDRLRAAERQKDLLLQEMSHRVKNKFAMIASMVELQKRNTSTPEVRAALESIGARVRVITRVHDYLQLSRMDGQVDVRQYLEGLCRSLEEKLWDLRQVSILVTCADLILPPEKALPLGLIVNELVTNAVKYAFPDGREGFVHVTLEKRGTLVKVAVSDNGVG
jgi:two-component sensor histidine kinase